MRAVGGYRLLTFGGTTLGAYLAAGSGTWTAMSDRNAKENFERVNARETLEKVAELPITTWNYRSQTNTIRHIGPVAQDFKAAFNVGETDIGITTVDADGVALAAIQGLNQKLEQQLKLKEAHIRALESRIDKLECLLRNTAPQNSR